jgi:16S rRNA (cytosine1402-N4)-methyltransferase
MKHIPVLLNEALEGLAIKPEGVYIDATFGRGGHSRAILNTLGEQGRLIALDRDPDAVKAAHEIKDPRFTIVHAAFSELGRVAQERGVRGKVDGILLDLGVSSPQLDDEIRGFSFLNDGPLDMRMDPTHGESVEEWLSKVDEQTLADIFYRYGEERYSRRIAKAIVYERTLSPLKSTRQLAELIARAHPKWEAHKHPATRCFQAMRIFINEELQELTSCAEQCKEVLKMGGRLAIITFHSLEDRLVKQLVKEKATAAALPRYFPIMPEQSGKKAAVFRAVQKAIKPSALEVKENPRSRSATLRVMEKVA